MIFTADLEPGEARAAYVARHIFPAAFALLPGRMDTREARALLLAIGLQESGFQHRHQVGGPAHGFWQFEQNGGVAGVITHRQTSTWISLACTALCYPSLVKTCYVAIEDNDVLACVFARLLLWTLPDVLPGREEPELAWLHYLSAWRPGKPHPETWGAHYARAWRVAMETT